MEAVGGWWLFERVTATAGPGRPCEASSTGDKITVIAVDSFCGPRPGGELPTVNPDGTVTMPTIHRWHVVMLRGVLVWMRHDWFEECRLDCDVR